MYVAKKDIIVCCGCTHTHLPLLLPLLQVFYVRKGSLLGDRLLNFTASIPYSDDTIQDVVKNVCEPLGYFPASPSEYGYGCVVNQR